MTYRIFEKKGAFELKIFTWDWEYGKGLTSFKRMLRVKMRQKKQSQNNWRDSQGKGDDCLLRWAHFLI
jgi:hypothetical protein